MESILHHFNYWMCIGLIMAGLYMVINSGNFVKKLMGLAIFQASVLLFYISLSYVSNARFPILEEGVGNYVNPLPHVLMLTAIVVGIATFAVGLAITVRIKESYGTIEEDEVLALDARTTSLADGFVGEKKPSPKKAPAKKKATKKKTAAKKAAPKKKPVAQKAPAKKKPAPKRAPAKKKTATKKGKR